VLVVAVAMVLRFLPAREQRAAARPEVEALAA
jgi:hypothetical protein